MWDQAPSLSGGTGSAAARAAPLPEAEPVADAAEPILRIDAELLEPIVVPLRIGLVGRTGPARRPRGASTVRVEPFALAARRVARAGEALVGARQPGGAGVRHPAPAGIAP